MIRVQQERSTHKRHRIVTGMSTHASLMIARTETGLRASDGSRPDNDIGVSMTTYSVLALANEVRGLSEVYVG